jgi:hypothetical protein
MALISSITVPYTKHCQHLGPEDRQPYALEKDAAHNLHEIPHRIEINSRAWILLPIHKVLWTSAANAAIELDCKCLENRKLGSRRNELSLSPCPATDNHPKSARCLNSVLLKALFLVQRLIEYRVSALLVFKAAV